MHRGDSAGAPSPTRNWVALLAIWRSPEERASLCVHARKRAVRHPPTSPGGEGADEGMREDRGGTRSPMALACVLPSGTRVGVRAYVCVVLNRVTVTDVHVFGPIATLSHTRRAVGKNPRDFVARLTPRLRQMMQHGNGVAFSCSSSRSFAAPINSCNFRNFRNFRVGVESRGSGVDNQF